MNYAMLCQVFLFSLLGLFVTACSSNFALRATVPYVVTSTPLGAEVVIDGQQAGVTPLAVDFYVSRWWIGLLRSPNGWAYGPETYKVTALPPPMVEAQHTAETQMVVPSETPQGGTVFFDLRQPPA